MKATFIFLKTVPLLSLVYIVTSAFNQHLEGPSILILVGTAGLFQDSPIHFIISSENCLDT